MFTKLSAFAGLAFAALLFVASGPALAGYNSQLQAMIERAANDKAFADQVLADRDAVAPAFMFYPLAVVLAAGADRLTVEEYQRIQNIHSDDGGYGGDQD